MNAIDIHLHARLYTKFKVNAHVHVNDVYLKIKTPLKYEGV